MFSSNLVKSTIASLNAAGITPADLPAIKQLPDPSLTSSISDIAAAIADSKHDDPYADPKVIELSARNYIGSIYPGLNATFHRDQRERQAQALENQIPELLEQLQAKFNETAEQLLIDSEPIKSTDDPKKINLETARQAERHAATDTLAGLQKLRAIIKAWEDIWSGLGKSGYGTRDGEAFRYMNATYEQWQHIRHECTIWSAIRHGAQLTLADDPKQVGRRYRIMADSKQAGNDKSREKFHKEEGARLLSAFKGATTI